MKTTKRCCCCFFFLWVSHTVMVRMCVWLWLYVCIFRLPINSTIAINLHATAAVNGHPLAGAKERTEWLSFPVREYFHCAAATVISMCESAGMCVCEMYQQKPKYKVLSPQCVFFNYVTAPLRPQCLAMNHDNEYGMSPRFAANASNRMGT